MNPESEPRTEPTREQWADWFRRCADNAGGHPDAHGLRLAADHLGVATVNIADGRIVSLIGSRTTR